MSKYTLRGKRGMAVGRTEKEALGLDYPYKDKTKDPMSKINSMEQNVKVLKGLRILVALTSLDAVSRKKKTMATRHVRSMFDLPVGTTVAVMQQCLDQEIEKLLAGKL